MSAYMYGALTTRRKTVATAKKTSKPPPEVKPIVDAVAALVPAEVLALHAAILSYTTSTSIGPDGNSVTEITDPTTLGCAFFGFLFLSVLLYIVPRLSSKDGWDFVRALIPPLAFIFWTMAQRATAFDAVWPEMEEAPRMSIALFGAVILLAIATWLAKKAES